MIHLEADHSEHHNRQVVLAAAIAVTAVLVDWHAISNVHSATHGRFVTPISVVRRTPAMAIAPASASTATDEFLPRASHATSGVRAHPMLAMHRVPTEAVDPALLGPLTEAPRPMVISMPPMIIRASPPAPVRVIPVAPAATNATMAVQESSSLTGEFQLLGVEYFLNGQRLRMPVADGPRTHSTFRITAKSGENVLSVNVMARGVAGFPITYLKDLTFVSEARDTFEAQPDDAVVVNVNAYDDHDMLKNMGDRLHVKVRTEVVPGGGTPTISESQ